MLKHLSLFRVGPTDRLDIDLDERLNVFTGDNGLGKSFVLDVAWWALTRTWATQPAMGRRDLIPGKKAPGARKINPPSASSRNRPSLTSAKAANARSPGFRTPRNLPRMPSICWTLRGARRNVEASAILKPGASPTEWTRSAGRPPLVGLVLYARIDGGFSLWDPARNYWFDKEHERPADYRFTREEVWDGKRNQDAPGVICEGLIRDWSDWQSNESSSEFKLLTKLLQILSPEPSERMSPGGPPRVLVPDDVRRIPMLKLPYGEVPLIHASAGMRRILALAYLLVWSWEKHRAASETRGIPPAKQMVLLIDEVEAHLHPRWQRVIVPAILEAIKHVQPDVSVQVLMTTHSPMVLASLEPHFEESRDQLFRFHLQNEAVHLDRMDWAKHGDATGWLVSEVFGLHEARSPEAEDALARAHAFLLSDHGKAKEARELQSELAELLPSLDPFWAVWRFGLQRMKLKVDAL